MSEDSKIWEDTISNTLQTQMKLLDLIGCLQTSVKTM